MENHVSRHSPLGRGTDPSLYFKETVLRIPWKTLEFISFLKTPLCPNTAAPVGTLAAAAKSYGYSGTSIKPMKNKYIHQPGSEQSGCSCNPWTVNNNKIPPSLPPPLPPCPLANVRILCKPLQNQWELTDSARLGMQQGWMS